MKQNLIPPTKLPKGSFRYVPTHPYAQPAPWCGDCGNYKFACTCKRAEKPRPLRPEDV